MKAERIGMMGGTFDPIHIGHLVIADEARRELELDRVLFVPAGTPPHKSSQNISCVEHRVAMTSLAIRSNESFELSLIEVERAGRSYTVDTLTQLQSDHPGAELFLIMGDDSAIDLMSWRRPFDIAKIAKIVTAARPGSRREDIERLPDQIRSSIMMISPPRLDISSSEIRSRALSGSGFRYLTTEAVASYIEQHRLYTYRDGGSN